jgi:hypothetical protein
MQAVNVFEVFECTKRLLLVCVRRSRTRNIPNEAIPLSGFFCYNKPTMGDRGEQSILEDRSIILGTFVVSLANDIYSSSKI